MGRGDVAPVSCRLGPYTWAVGRTDWGLGSVATVSCRRDPKSWAGGRKGLLMWRSMHGFVCDTMRQSVYGATASSPSEECLSWLLVSGELT